MDFEKARQLKASLIPKEGFNLVGVDTHEMPDEALYFISHHKSYDDAMGAKRKKAEGGVKCYIYSPTDEA